MDGGLPLGGLPRRRSEINGPTKDTYMQKVDPEEKDYLSNQPTGGKNKYWSVPKLNQASR